MMSKRTLQHNDTPLALEQREEMGVRWVKIIFLYFSLFTFHSSFLFSQNHADKIVKEHGKKLYLHIIVKGETIYGISKDYNVSVRDIVLENPSAIDGISPGDTLRIIFPSVIVKKDSAYAQASLGQYIYHKVAAKETAYSLAKQYKISVALLDSLNPELKTKGLRTGQTIRIPVYTQPSPPVLPTIKQQQPDNPPIQPKQPVITQEPVKQPKHDTAKEKNAFKYFVVQQQQKADTSIKNPVLTTNKPVVNQGQLLNRYNIALLLPFASEGSDTARMSQLLAGTAQLPLLTQISAGFYQGALVAIDSLSKQGIKVNLYVYNVPSSNDTASSKIDSILRSSVMASVNLIIGPAYPYQFKQVARYATQHNIPIVSPLSNENNVLQDNAYTSKATPSPATEMEQMADYIAAHYHTANVIVLHHRYTADDMYFDAFIKRFNADLQVDSMTDSAAVAEYSVNLNKLGEKINKDKNNVIVVPYQGTSFVTKLVNQLANSKYADNDSLVVFGMHNWLNIDVLDMGNLDTLNFHFPSNEYINYCDSCTKGFIRKYRNSYYTEPNYYACQGFDVAYFYLSMLKKFGTAMQDHLGDSKYVGIHTSFDFHRPDAASGYENKAIFILEYKNYMVGKKPL